MADHTPGPWTVNQVFTRVLAPDHSFVATLEGPTQEDDEVNGRLIAAAPDLLAALKSLMRAEQRPHVGPLLYDSLREDAWAQADAAIAKAEGRS